MTLLVAFGLGIAVGASLQALVLALLAGHRDAPPSPQRPWHFERRMGGGEIWKLDD
jgi:hypothetical protein